LLSENKGAKEGRGKREELGTPAGISTTQAPRTLDRSRRRGTADPNFLTSAYDKTLRLVWSMLTAMI